MKADELPSWLKWIYLAFVVLLVPAYAWWYGWANFLWFSNLALLLGLVGTWLRSRFLVSAQLVSVLVPELVWMAGFAGGLALGGEPPFGVTAYMFDEEIPAFIRALSLYHVILPVLLFCLVWRLGYDCTAWRKWVPIGWCVLIVAFAVSRPEQNINWVFGPGQPQTVVPAWLWLVFQMLAVAGLWWLTHRMIRKLLVLAESVAGRSGE